MSKHTPGPWSIKRFEVATENRHKRVCLVDNPLHDDAKGTRNKIAIANGNLIAAAPDMYGVLKEVQKVLADSGLYYDTIAAEKVAEALAKAEGNETPQDKEIK